MEFYGGFIRRKLYKYTAHDINSLRSNDRSHMATKQNRPKERNVPFFLSWALFLKISGKYIDPRDREAQVLHKVFDIFSHLPEGSIQKIL